MKLKWYKVYYSSRASAKVHSGSVAGARKRAWGYVAGGYTYGWTKKDFLARAKVEVI